MPCDAELAARARLGDRDAFQRLCDRHRRQVLRIAAWEAEDADQAPDIAQDSFLAALTAISALRDPGRFAPWLAAIVRNQARMARRSARQRPACDPLPPDLPAGTADHWSALSSLDLARALGEAIGSLRPTHAAALRLHYWYGLKTSEIAARLGVAQGTVKRWLHEARRAIREEMIRMGAAPAGAQMSRLAAVVARSDDWDQVGPLAAALRRADCETAVNPDPIPQEVAIVILDYEVEGGKGVEWLVHLRQTRPGVPVLVLGPGRDRTVFACWAAGAAGYLTLPFKAEELALFAAKAIEAPSDLPSSAEGAA